MAQQGGHDHELAMPGLLENVPCSWLILLIRSLPSGDKLALFQTSKWLAKHVVEHAKGVTLYLPGWMKPVTAEDLGKPHGIIPELLMHAPRDARITALTSRSALQAYAADINTWVSDLLVLEDAEGCTATPACLDVCWGTFTKLTYLHLCKGATELDVMQLSQALHAGHLQQLQTFGLYESKASTEGLKLLACALQADTCLATMYTDNLKLLHHMNGYRSLHNLHVDDCYLSKDVIRRLCDHSTLQHVELSNCSLDECGTWPECSWKSVTLKGCEMKVLASLPLSCIRQVVFRDATATRDEKDVEALKDALTNHAAKLVCHDSFCLFGVCAHTAQLVRHMQNQPRLSIYHSMRLTSDLKVLWKALPAFITSVAFWRSSQSPMPGCIKGMDWGTFWDSMPVTVTAVAVYGCHLVPVAVLAVLVRTAPLHVGKLSLYSFKNDVQSAWKAAGLAEEAPAHLTLEI